MLASHVPCLSILSGVATIALSDSEAVSRKCTPLETCFLQKLVPVKDVHVGPICKRHQTPRCPRIPTPSLLDSRLLRLLEPLRDEWLVLKLRGTIWPGSQSYQLSKSIFVLQFCNKGRILLGVMVEEHCSRKPSTQAVESQILSGSSVRAVSAGSVADDEVLVSDHSEWCVPCFSCLNCSELRAGQSLVDT